MYRTEYPRPELVREPFLNLNGSWDFAFDYNKAGKEQNWQLLPEIFNHKIEVPFCPESKLSGLAHTNFINACWYHRTFCVPDAWKGQRVLLHFEAVYYLAEVFVNGRSVGTHQGGHTPFTFDITDCLTDGENRLVVYCAGDARNKLEPSGKQCHLLNSAGCFYTRTTGIWQTVWMECVPAVSVSEVKIDTDPENQGVAVTLHFTGAGRKKVSLHASFNGKPVGTASGTTALQEACLYVPLSEMHWWDLDTPDLYDLDITVESDGGCDRVRSYFGIRTLSYDRKGLKLNGRYVFLRTVLDQGFYPDGVLTAPSEEDLVQDILLSKRMGFNGARLHQKVFERRFLYHCDRLGYLVWGEYPSWGFDYGDPARIPDYCREWLESVRRDYNHPAIIGWIPMNENWGTQSNELVKAVYEVTKMIDPNRPVIDVSWNFHVVTDFYDIHDYEQDNDVFANRYRKFEGGRIPDALSLTQPLQYDRNMPFYLSEYGGLKWPPDAQGWGYGQAVADEEDFETRYCLFAKTLLENPDICGLCYTQLYDVEQELNGLYYYSRKPKFSESMLDRMAAVIGQKAAIEE